MKNIFVGSVSLFLLVAVLQAAAPTGLDQAGQMQSVGTAPKEGFSFTRLENGVQLHVNGVTKNVIFYGPATVRVNANLGRTFANQPSIVVVEKPAAVPFNIQG